MPLFDLSVILSQEVIVISYSAILADSPTFQQKSSPAAWPILYYFVRSSAILFWVTAILFLSPSVGFSQFRASLVISFLVVLPPYSTLTWLISAEIQFCSPFPPALAFCKFCLYLRNLCYYTGLFCFPKLSLVWLTWSSDFPRICVSIPNCSKNLN